MKVEDPHGRAWRVRRRWTPWSPRRRWHGSGDALDVADVASFFDDLLPGPILIALFIVILLLVLIPAFILLVEVALIALVVLGTFVARVLLRRPWIVEAHSADVPAARRYQVVGWRRSTAVIAELAGAIRSGGTFISPHAAPVDAGIDPEPWRARPG